MSAGTHVAVPAKWRHVPEVATHAALQTKRTQLKRPDISYDVDGDGVVSVDDMRIARHFDADSDGKLTLHEHQQAVEARKRGIKFKDTSQDGHAFGISKRMYYSMYTGDEQETDGTDIGFLKMKREILMGGNMGTRSKLRMDRRTAELTDLTTKYAGKLPPAFVTYTYARDMGYVEDPKFKTRTEWRTAMRVQRAKDSGGDPQQIINAAAGKVHVSLTDDTRANPPGLAHVPNPAHSTRTELLTDRRERDVATLHSRVLELELAGYIDSGTRAELKLLRNVEKLRNAKSIRTNADIAAERKAADEKKCLDLLDKHQAQLDEQRASTLDYSDPNKPFYTQLPGYNADPPVARSKALQLQDSLQREAKAAELLAASSSSSATAATAFATAAAAADIETAESLTAAASGTVEAAGGVPPRKRAVTFGPNTRSNSSTLAAANAINQALSQAEPATPRRGTGLDTSFSMMLLEQRDMIKTTELAPTAIVLEDRTMSKPLYSSFSKDFVFHEPEKKKVKPNRPRPKTAQPPILVSGINSKRLDALENFDANEAMNASQRSELSMSRLLRRESRKRPETASPRLMRFAAAEEHSHLQSSLPTNTMQSDDTAAGLTHTDSGFDLATVVNAIENEDITDADGNLLDDPHVGEAQRQRNDTRQVYPNEYTPRSVSVAARINATVLRPSPPTTTVLAKPQTPRSRPQSSPVAINATRLALNLSALSNSNSQINNTAAVSPSLSTSLTPRPPSSALARRGNETVRSGGFHVLKEVQALL